MRSFLSALPLLATTMVFAQAPVQPPRVFKLSHVYPMSGWSCPVGMTAQRQAAGATQWVISFEDSGNPSRLPPGKMGVRVSLKTSKDRAFREAKVAVSYMVSPSGAMLLGGVPSAQTRTFNLFASDDPDAELERSLLLGFGVSVTRVKLRSLTYADGTVWQPDGNYNCSVRVSHFLPVASR